ncbi:MAG: phosphomannomutase/phosphoglucomutase [Bacilli bacterium]|nr:phosphomannomutase/phosphoglucomutase [Bacilli bacterium]
MLIPEKKLNKYIFRGYDIRGVYPTDLNKEVANIIGKSFGTYVRRLGHMTAVVGRDNRYSSDELAESLIDGILSTGVNVIDLGLVTTPMYYYACIKLNNPTGIMVTASHNPKDDNGFKFAFDERGNARGEMIEEFRDFTFQGDFDSGEGKLSFYNIREEYLELFKKSLDFGNRRVKVVIDLGNGTTSCIAEELYKMFPIDVDVLFGDSDPSFPNHHPDPCVEKNLEALKKRVLETNADLGIGFDGDGDRLGVVDELGNYVATDKYMIIIIRDIINKVAKKEFLYDVKCSKSLTDEIEKLGAKGICYRTGNSYTKAKVKDDNLPFGGELSGHVYFNDKWPCFDSGLYAGLRLLEILSKTNKKTSELLEGINKYYSTEELKFPSSDDKKFGIVDKIKEYCKNNNYNINDIDGVRVTFDYGWALVRCSNTGPNITARFEANSKEKLEELQQEFIGQINKYNV